MKGKVFLMLVVLLLAIPAHEADIAPRNVSRLPAMSSARWFQAGGNLGAGKTQLDLVSFGYSSLQLNPNDYRIGVDAFGLKGWSLPDGMAWPGNVTNLSGLLLTFSAPTTRWAKQAAWLYRPADKAWLSETFTGFGSRAVLESERSHVGGISGAGPGRSVAQDSDPIPEPASIALFGGGLLLLTGLMRRRFHLRA
jgi:hypothetical protein